MYFSVCAQFSADRIDFQIFTKFSKPMNLSHVKQFSFGLCLSLRRFLSKELIFKFLQSFQNQWICLMLNNSVSASALFSTDRIDFQIVSQVFKDT